MFKSSSNSNDTDVPKTPEKKKALGGIGDCLSSGQSPAQLDHGKSAISCVSDILKTPEKKISSAAVGVYLTPQPSLTQEKKEDEKQCWTVTLCEEKIESENKLDFNSNNTRWSAFSGRKLSFEKSSPLIPGLVEQMDEFVKKLTCLIKEFSKKEKNDQKILEKKKKLDASNDRKILEKKKKKLDAQIAWVAINVILWVDSSLSTFDNKEKSVIIKCINNHSDLKKRFNIVTKLIQDKNVDQIWPNELKDYEALTAQFAFENKLAILGINFLPLSELREVKSSRTRIILTDIEKSSKGFEYMFAWLNKHHHEVEPGKYIPILKNAGPAKIVADLNNIRPDELEMAWGHLMNNGRHLGENIVFVTNEETLQVALKSCSPDSTFVLDAHGGGNNLTTSKGKLCGNELHIFIKRIVSMLGPKITHVILSVCATGVLNNAEYVKSRNKYSANEVLNDSTLDFKNRKKIFVSNTDVAALFEKLTLNIKPFAALFAEELLNREGQDPKFGTAFTFSPSLLLPDDKSGVVGVPLSIIERRDWPEFHTDWAKDGRGKELSQICYKSITLYNNEENRKALGAAGHWSNKLAKSLFVDANQSSFSCNLFAEEDQLSSSISSTVTNLSSISCNLFAEAYQSSNSISSGEEVQSSISYRKASLL